MFEHLVIFKFNSAITKEHEQVLLSKLQGLKQAVPGIIALTAGLNVTEETDNIHGYSLGLRVTFESQEALPNTGRIRRIRISLKRWMVFSTMWSLSTTRSRDS